MPISFCCDRCARSLSAEPGLSSVTCPGCGRSVAVPAADPAAWWLGEAKPPPAPPAAPAAPANNAAWWLGSAPPSPPPPPASVTPAPLVLAAEPVPVAQLAPVPPPLPADTPAGPRRQMPVAAVIVGGVVLAAAACVTAVLALPGRGEPVEEPGKTALVQAPRQEQRDLERPRPSAPSSDPVAPAPSPPTPEELPLPPADPPAPAPAPERRPVEPVRPPAPEVEKPSPPTPAPEARPPVPEKWVVKRRLERSEDDLLKQLQRAPELRLDTTIARRESLQLLAVGQQAARLGKDAGTTVALLEKRADLAGLPWRKGDACKISPTTASHLEDGSIALRSFMTSVGTTAVSRIRAGTAPALPDPGSLASSLNKTGEHNHWRKPEAIPAMQQLLMAEHEAIREVLVDQLARIEGKKASEALAQRALFDLHPRVRERALKELAKRPANEYREVLLRGFEHPWPAVAEHAAEALATLKMKETVPTLLTFLDKPDPRLPCKAPKKGMVVKEMVRVNHLLNCLMCHAPSTKTDDKVRGRIPPLGQPLPPAFTRAYYADRTGVFVRADVTYLRQDFSVPLPVKNHGVWPEVQRFDFLVRERAATLHDLNVAKRVDAKKPTEHQRSLFFALRELTGTDPGPTVEDWKQLFLKRKLEVRTIDTGFKLARAVAVDRDGRIYVADSGTILRKQNDGRPGAWLKDAGDVAGLAIDGKGNLLAAQGKAAQVVRIDAGTREPEALARKFDGRRLNHPRRLAADGHGGVYFSDDPGSEVRDTGAVYYRSAHGSVTRLALGQSRPRSLGLSPDGKTLYVASASAAEVMAYPVESAGSIGTGRVVCRLAVAPGTKGGPADLAVDDKGRLHLLNPAAQTVEVFAPEGAKLGIARLPDAPVACCAARGTLYVLTRKALYAVDLADLDTTRVASR